MSASKKRATAAENGNCNGVDDLSDTVEEMEEDSDAMLNQTVQVDFDARNPEDCDFHGICKLLRQLLLKANINVSQIADTIIAQNYVGSVIMQVEDPAEVDSDDDGEDDVFGLTTVINITDKKEQEAVQQLRDVLHDRCQQVAPRVLPQFLQLLNDDQNQIGLVLNERFINLPPQLSVPALHSLWKECERAVRKKMKFAFTHYLFVMKTYRPLQMPGLNGTVNGNWVFVNPEEECIYQEAELKFSYSVKAERDTAVNSWSGGDSEEELEPFRTVVVISKDEIPQVMAKMDELFSNT